MIYFVGVFAVALAALNTGNNLLFLVLGCLLAGILLSGIVSRITLTGIELKLTLPEHVFARQPAAALLELTNLKQTLPSFSLRVISDTAKDKKESGGKPAAALLQQPVYFPYLARKQSAAPIRRTDVCPPRRLRAEGAGGEHAFPFRLPGKNAEDARRSGNHRLPTSGAGRKFLRDSSADQRRTGKPHARSWTRPLRDPRFGSDRQRALCRLEGLGALRHAEGPRIRTRRRAARALCA